MKVGLEIINRIKYPEKPYHPSKKYPEYPFTETQSENYIYEGIRTLFFNMGLDRENYGKEKSS